MLCHLYRKICKRWGPRGLTLSAYAWVVGQETGNVWLRDRIDGLFLFLGFGRNHCQASFQRHRRTTSSREAN